MSGQNGPDEAARLEAALARIAQAASASARRKPAQDPHAQGHTQGLTQGLTVQPAPPHGTNGATHQGLAGRLDSLIAELRDVLGTPPL